MWVWNGFFCTNISLVHSLCRVQTVEVNHEHVILGFQGHLCVALTFFQCTFDSAHPNSSPLSIVQRGVQGRPLSQKSSDVPMRGKRKGGVEVLLVCKVFFSCRCPLSWTKEPGEGDNVTGLSWGKVIYCSLSADSTGQDTSSPISLLLMMLFS